MISSLKFKPVWPQLLLLLFSGLSHGATTGPGSSTPVSESKHHKVLILGGGVAGVIAARTLHQNGIDDFLVVEARHELGGRMMSFTFANKTLEQGANWVQGTQTGNGPANPIFELAKKHNVMTQFNDWFGSVTTYDSSGQVDYLDVFNQSTDNFDNITVLAGSRVDSRLVDISARTGYALIGTKRTNPHAQASEYYQFDWEYAQTPAESSLIASSWGNNFTYNADDGGFSDDNQMSLDQRGFKTLIQKEADEFLTVRQRVLNATIRTVVHSQDGVTITLGNGSTLSAEYALCTFSLGVLQNDDVQFYPPLPHFKQEAIQGMVMATYTKIFLKFPHKFWFSTEMAIYADSERGRYPVWQSLDHPNFFPGSGIVFVTVTGDFAIRVEALSDSQAKNEVMGIVRSMFSNITVPEPTDFFFPRWHSNPLFRGSYSNWPPSFFSQHLDNLRANVGRLYFAGEATSRKYFGFLHGAYFEGLNIGQIVADCVKSTSCADLEHFLEVTNAHSYETS
ncbi:amine oxidase [Phlegmacium glaucopus]|nr:amine oxidase [Phlegmacium glaucopus]